MLSHWGWINCKRIQLCLVDPIRVQLCAPQMKTIFRYLSMVLCCGAILLYKVFGEFNYLIDKSSSRATIQMKTGECCFSLMQLLCYLVEGGFNFRVCC